ncbi:MAG: hypothetical protein ACREDL_19985 [Bradyrhizobium sp.]
MKQSVIGNGNLRGTGIFGRGGGQDDEAVECQGQPIIAHRRQLIEIAAKPLLGARTGSEGDGAAGGAIGIGRRLARFGKNSGRPRVGLRHVALLALP